MVAGRVSTEHTSWAACSCDGDDTGGGVRDCGDRNATYLLAGTRLPCWLL